MASKRKDDYAESDSVSDEPVHGVIDNKSKQPRDRCVTDREGDDGCHQQLRTARVQTLTGRLEGIREAEQTEARTAGIANRNE